MPSAASANALQRPSFASARWRLNWMNGSGTAIIATPPARASEHSPLRRAWTARCSVTSDDEHAVSAVSAGPSSPKV